MALSSNRPKALLDKIAAREQFLRKAVRFVEKLVLKRGRVIKRYQGSSHTNTAMELLDFGDFSFKTDWGQSMMGGNEVFIWYHPNSTFEGRNQSTPVLSVYYPCASFGTDDCRVNTFYENPAWQSALGDAMKNPTKIIAGIKRKERESKRFELAEAKKSQKQLALAERAERLGVK